MGHSLTVDSALSCPHGGTVRVSTSNTSVRAGGSFAATASDAWTITGCPFQIPATPPIPSPCVQVIWVVPNMRVRIAGSPALSRDSVGICLSGTGIPQGTVVVSNTQTSVQSQ
ncbi:MAG TPA: hypothetical protein VNZ57_15990 [Longimicrobiales bacterium]|nr:hypothetical protein [Longimicrobiales bacterium]